MLGRKTGLFERYQMSIHIQSEQRVTEAAVMASEIEALPDPAEGSCTLWRSRLGREPGAALTGALQIRRDQSDAMVYATYLVSRLW